MPHVHVVSDLVANVMNVGVAVGDTVEVGDEIVLEESMKMEIPVLTEVAGKVVEVKVEPGDVVQEGEILAVIETPGR
jgi:acetyl-CoA carboxylase biotin carboxyl carrier protein